MAGTVKGNKIYYNPKITKSYIKGKFRLLRQFGISLTTEIENKILTAKTEIEADHICLSLIDRKLGVI